MEPRRQARTLLVFFFAIFRALDPSAGQDSCSVTEIEALEAFQRGASSLELSSWSRNSSCCQWRGVRCAASIDQAYREAGIDYRVQEIRLSGLKLRGGNIIDSLARLRGLSHLDLSSNALSGSFPGNASSLPRLERLDLSANNLSGPILLPPGSFQAASYLNLSSNRFDGSWNFSGGIKLQVLDLSNNALSGQIFESLCEDDGSSQLRVLNFSGNDISSRIPASITKCRGLETFEGEDNRLQGRIPSSLSQLPLLRSIRLSFNSLSGSIPSELSSLANLEELWLNKNSIKGGVFLTTGFTSLRVFSARENRLSGQIAVNCSSMNSSLAYLDLSYNLLNGTIPAAIGECHRLETLALTGNFLEGRIPSQLGSLTNLTTLMLSKNNLVGRIPLESLRECSSLVALVLSKNYFSGTLDMAPSPVGSFRNLQLLAVGNSNLSGTIPLWLTNSTKLQVLDLSWNSFTGEVPLWIGDFHHLFYVDLSNNSFSGALPDQLANLKSLRGDEIDTSGIKAVESILFVKHKNNMTRLQYNQVSALPPSIILASNRFHGRIPDGYGALRRLVSLDLGINLLSGVIPASLGNLSNLESMDLSQNSLGGAIPTTLTRLFSLARLNLSFNKLEGPIPLGNQFSTFTASAYAGNPRLCGYPLPDSCGDGSSPQSQQRSTTKSERSKNSSSLAIGIGVSVALGIRIWIWMVSPKQAVHHRDDEEEDSAAELRDLSEMMKRTVEVFHNRELLRTLVKQQRPLTNADLVKATDNFDQSNIVGCGGFGLVFVASLPDGTKVAIKRLTGDCLQVEREFEAEVQALAMADHPNLVTLQGYSSYGEHRLLIYSYMENGSLDSWLHESAKHLDWSTRLDIARGAARGLAYLHLACQPHIVHRDIKSSNILLDGRFVAHLADFGLARLMLPTATHVSTEMVGTLGYIPPEYAQSWMASPKGDVYSFGVVLLELLSRRRPVDVCRANGVYDLVAWVREMKGAGRGVEVMDPALRERGNEEEMERMLEVACQCINPNPARRPGIEEVVTWLEGIGHGV
ncbi:phytosulfokine receptor 1 [Selaginella moellendorffii]|nr:phytosulfokine receptor 1 [Selaginella moellendorffii]|eukprot:XP_002965468.2 phytosulfokine receptor 1 [Selaginella moellendorffii]